MTELIPVNEWVFNRYRITYHRGENDPAGLTKHLVISETHLESTIEQDWPSSAYNYYKWEIVQENVPAPRRIGSSHGIPLYASGWE